jgi:hypothetical protein
LFIYIWFTVIYEGHSGEKYICSQPAHHALAGVIDDCYRLRGNGIKGFTTKGSAPRALLVLTHYTGGKRADINGGACWSETHPS